MRAGDKCSLPHRDNLMQPIQMQLSQKLKTFSSFSMHFGSLGEILDILRKKMTLIAYLLLRLRPGKNMVRYMCKKSCLRLPFQKEDGQRV